MGSNGRKPPAPRPHRTSGYGPMGSGGGNKTLVWISAIIFGLPTLVVLAAIGFVVKGYVA